MAAGRKKQSRLAMMLQVAENNIIKYTLNEFSTVPEAAEYLGISKTHLYRMMREHGIAPPQRKGHRRVKKPATAKTPKGATNGQSDPGGETV